MVCLNAKGKAPVKSSSCLTQSVFVLVATAAMGACVAQETPSLREAFASKFEVGTALSARQLLEPQEDVLALVAKQFSVVTPENVMKWAVIHPEPDRYDFTAADALVDFAEQHGQKVVGHTLVWHSQCPNWVFQDASGEEISREALIGRMKQHIETVVGRYKGRVMGWDVVNEAIEGDGSWRDSKWRRIIGDDYLELAFRFAHEADPSAELYYNDYSMTGPGKRRTVAALVQDFREQGVAIHGVGLQGHWGLDHPDEQELDDALKDYSALGLKVMITELDVNVLPRPGGRRGADVSERAERRAALDPYRDGLPDEVQRQLADRYALFFRMFEKHDQAITRVTFWGVHDGHSWHNNWPVRGRTAHSLLFDRELQPKPAFWSVIETAEQ